MLALQGKCSPAGSALHTNLRATPIEHRYGHYELSIILRHVNQHVRAYRWSAVRTLQLLQGKHFTCTIKAESAPFTLQRSRFQDAPRMTVDQDFLTSTNPD